MCYDASAGWSSLVARRAHNPEVVGSNPTPATILVLHKELRPTPQPSEFANPEDEPSELCLASGALPFAEFDRNS